MTVTVLVGAQWGDEGKGKIVDRLSREASLVVRYQGGDNAGHTIVRGDETFKLNLIPSGILHEETLCALGSGVIIDPAVLRAEVEALDARGVDTSRVRISPQCHVIMPYHIALDEAREAAAHEGAGRIGTHIGTTRRGIGPCYTDKIARVGIRVQDLVHPELMRAKLTAALHETNALLTSLYGRDPFDVEPIVEHAREHAAFLAPFLADVSGMVLDAVSTGDNVLLEGAQGTLLDVDHGTYPFVTSSSPVAGGACTGAGIGPMLIDRVIGVVKAYTTRVGSGPFPTELTDETGAWLVEHGAEFGTTTGRQRRCGWLDLPALRWAVTVNGLSELSLTKLDVLSGLETLQVCTNYRLSGGDEVGDLSQVRGDLGSVEPVLREHEGWSEPLDGITEREELPVAAQDYLDMIERELGVPITSIGVGQERAALIES